MKQLPNGRTAFVKWEPIQIDGPYRALLLSDIHLPYHNKQALQRAIKYGKDARANMVILNGDALDFFAISFWEKDPRERKFSMEIEMGKLLFEVFREEFPRARIIFKLGNHEERYERYLRVKAPELLGIADFQLDNMLGLSKMGVELVEDKRPIRLGTLNVIHGHEFRFMPNIVNPARSLYLKARAYATCGHFHQSSNHTDKTIEQRVLSTWSAGCLCDLHPEYLPLNNWCHGFQFVEVDADGKFNMANKIIRSGRVF